MCGVAWIGVAKGQKALPEDFGLVLRRIAFRYQGHDAGTIGGDTRLDQVERVRGKVGFVSGQQRHDVQGG